MKASALSVTPAITSGLFQSAISSQFGASSACPQKHDHLGYEQVLRMISAMIVRLTISLLVPEG